MVVAERAPQQQETTSATLWMRPGNWLLATLLIYFIVDARFSFTNPQGNTALGGQGGVGAGNSDTTIGVYLHVMVCLLTFYFVTPHLGAILRAFSGVKSLALLAILPLTSLLWSTDRLTTLKSGTYLAISMILAVYYAQAIPAGKQMQLLWMASWVTTLLSISLALLVPAIGIDNHTGRGNEWQGVFLGKNNCATSTFFLLMPSLLMSARGTFVRVAKYLSIGLILLLIAMTHSISGWIITASYVIFIGVLKFFGSFRRKDRLAIVAASSVALITAALAAYLNSERLLRLFGRDLTFSGRTGIWSALMLSIMKRPLLGYGYHAFWQGMHGESANVIVAVHWITGYAHNGFLELWAELGALALGLFLISFVKGVRDGVTCFYVGRPSSVDWYLGVLVYTVLYNLSEASLMYDFNLVWFLYVVSCVSLHFMAQQRRRELRLAAYHRQWMISQVA